MKCIYCDETVDISLAEYNVLNYGGIAKISSPCCGKLIGVKRVVRLDYFPTSSSDDVDDWGTPFNKEHS